MTSPTDNLVVSTFETSTFQKLPSTFQKLSTFGTSHDFVPISN